MRAWRAWEINLEAIKLWQIDDGAVTALQVSNRMESEEVLENILVKNAGLLLEGLTLVGRQTPTEGGPLDLLGVDGDGKLCVFELKRGTLARDAVAQIIDYASNLDGMDIPSLATHIEENAGHLGIDKIENFEGWYVGRHETLESLKPLRLFLVGLGVDDRTERMVRFLANNTGMDISLLTFHGFDSNGKTLLAKQVEVEGSADVIPRPARTWLNAAETRERLKRRIEGSGVSELFAAIRDMFGEAWKTSREYIQPGAIAFYLMEDTESGRRPRSYGRIVPDPGKVRIVFYGRTVNLRRKEFASIKEVLQYESYRGPGDTEGVYEELIFPLDVEDWETHKDMLTSVTRSVYEAWEEKGRANVDA